MAIERIDVGRADHLALAMDLAGRCLIAGDPPFGAVLASEDCVLSTGGNATESGRNPLRHAELEALTDYCARGGRSLAGSASLTLYCSTEPCLMCMGALHWAGVRHVVFGGSQQALCQLRGHGVFLTASERRMKFPHIQFAGPVLPLEAMEQWRAFYRADSSHAAGGRAPSHLRGHARGAP